MQLQSELAGLGIPSSGCDARDELSPLRQKQLDTIETLSQLEALEATRRGWYETFLGAEEQIAEMKHEVFGLMEAMQVSHGLTGGLGPRDGTRTFYAALASWSRRYGLVVSPGFGMLEFFKEGNGPGAIAQRIYSEVSAAHKELLAKVERWTKPRSYSIPPLLSIIVSEARSRADFPRVLIELRHRFSGLRQDMRKLSAQLNAETSWQQKLNVVTEIESVRDVVLSKASRADRQSIVRGTWDIVKKKSAWEALMSLADLALEWDKKRQLVVGIRHFIDLEKLALEVRAEDRHMRRLFGQIDN